MINSIMVAITYFDVVVIYLKQYFQFEHIACHQPHIINNLKCMSERTDRLDVNKTKVAPNLRYVASMFGLLILPCG